MKGGAARLRPFSLFRTRRVTAPSTSRDGRMATHPTTSGGVNLPLKVPGMEACMSFVRFLPAHRRRRMSKTVVVVAGLSAWLVLGLVSQAAFQLIG